MHIASFAIKSASGEKNYVNLSKSTNPQTKAIEFENHFVWLNADNKIRSTKQIKCIKMFSSNYEVFLVSFVTITTNQPFPHPSEYSTIRNK